MVIKGFCERIVTAKCSSKTSTETLDSNRGPACSKVGSYENIVGGQLQ